MIVGAFEFTIFYGCMGSEKSFEVIRYLRDYSYDHPDKVLAFKPYLKDTEEGKWIVSRKRKDVRFPSAPIPYNQPERILELVQEHTSRHQMKLSDLSLIGYDELQFFTPQIVKVIQELSQYVSQVGDGLNTDYKNAPFGVMPELIAIAECSHHLTGFCSVEGCTARSTKTFRDPRAGRAQVVLGNIDVYLPMCKKHYFQAINQGLDGLKIRQINTEI
ncbi:MAG: hypothetical protein HY602_00790 [Parcubacteria group bacterium]|nr:hypothetical protein [Parcubacteria group bacterium]